MATNQPPPTVPKLNRFLEAQHIVYGPLPTPLTPETARSWSPPPAPGAGGHKGRYLWTDAFGLVNFLTLSRADAGSSEAQDEKNKAYLVLATRLADSVHGVLGRTRDGSARLPGATDSEPLAGGLRIGKMDESGPDSDGMYHHYLTLWMFALERLARATGERKWIELAVQLGVAMGRAFVRTGDDGRVRLVWKVGTDGRTVLVGREGHLDAATGFAVLRLVRRTAMEVFGMSEDTLDREIEEHRVLMGRHGGLAASGDPLDLGMGLWMSQFFGEEEGARRLGDESLQLVPRVLGGVMARDVSRRLAFREFGTCLGVQCYDGADEDLLRLVRADLRFWEDYLEESTDEDLRPISLVMYAAALIPGAFKDGYLDRG